MNAHIPILLLLTALSQSPAFAADPPPSIRCGGIYCRETEDRDWHVRIAGSVISPAGVYIVVNDAANRIIFRGKIPAGEYPSEKPYEVKVAKDNVVGDYLLTIFGIQTDFASIIPPYTDLPFEVYGKTFFQVMPRGSGIKPYTEIAPGGLFFQVPPGAEEIKIEQSMVAWTIHAQDGSVVFDVLKDGQTDALPDHNNRIPRIGTFKATPGKTYILGHSLYWFFASPELYVAVSPDRWFTPDPQLHLDPTWWRKPK